MERIYPFLHEDVLFIINEYAIERTEKKALHEELFKTFLERNLIKLNIRDAWVHWLLGMNFENMETFIHILEVYHSDYLNRNYYIQNLHARNEKEVSLFHDYGRVPLGPRLKLYHYFINDLRYQHVNGSFRSTN